MLKQLAILLMIFPVLAANFSRVVVYAGFTLNQNYIATNLCENRDKPMMHCNGKCYLAKKLKQAAETEKKQSEKGDFSKLEITFFQKSSSTFIQPPVISNELKILYPSYTCLHSSRSIDSIFRPPRSGA